MRKCFLFTFFLVLILTSCSSKKSTSTKIKIFSGNVSIAGSGVGGAMLYGESKGLGLRFAQPINSLLLEKDVPNGDWSFYAMMWDGSSPLTGIVKCAKPVSYSLKGQAVDVSLILTQAACNDSMFVKPNAFYTYSAPNYLNGLSVTLCPPTTTQAELSTNNYCSGSYTGMATGMKVRMMGKNMNGGFFPSDLASSCISLSSGSTNFNLQIISGNIPDFLGATAFEVFYSPTYPTCNGDGCCTGKMDNYFFPNGFNNPTFNPDEASATANYGNSLYLKEHTSSKKLVFTGSAVSGSAEYKTCNEAIVELQDGSGTGLVSTEAITFAPSCNDKCTFYTDDSCTTAASSYTMANGTSSQNIYFTPKGPTMNLINSGMGDKYAGDIKHVSVHTTWANIDSAFLWSEANLSSFPNKIYASPAEMIPGKIWIYETRSGNRGALRFNSVTTVSGPANNTVNFDFNTWSPGGSLVGSNVNITSTACFTGNCFWELDNNTGSGATSGSIEAWWEDLSGSLYFNPQASPFFSLP